MMASPDCRCCASFCTVCSVGPPAGTMIQTARGGFSFEIKSSSDDEPVAPSLPSCWTASGLRSETTRECPPRMSRRVIFEPMRPKPTIPNCMTDSYEQQPMANCISCGCPTSPAFARSGNFEYQGCGYISPKKLQRLLYCRLQRCQAVLQILAQVHSQCASSALRQHLEVPARLRRLYDAERIFLSGHWQFHRIVARDLQKHSRVRTTFVSLPG